MYFLFAGKRQRLFAGVNKAFPAECREDVAEVCNRLPGESYFRQKLLYCKEQTTWALSSGGSIQIPYRVYISDCLDGMEEKLTTRQQIIYHCIFSRSYDGYVREKHIKALLEQSLPEWAMPYIIKICDEYVVEILQLVYDRLSNADCSQYRALCSLNFDSVRLGHCRMISYWAEYYRSEWYRFRDYIGKKLYAECFGYRKTGQRAIQIGGKDSI